MKQKLEVLEGCHNSALGGGHFGRDKTLKKVTERFYWLGIVDDVKEFRRTCDRCQRANRYLVVHGLHSDRPVQFSPGTIFA